MSVPRLSELSLHAINENFLVYCIIDNVIKKLLNILELNIYQLFRLVIHDRGFLFSLENIYKYFKQIHEKTLHNTYIYKRDIFTI